MKSSSRKSPRKATKAAKAKQSPQILPDALLDLSLERLALTEELTELCRGHGIATVRDLLDLPLAKRRTDPWFDAEAAEQVRFALGQVLAAGLAQFEPTDALFDWSSLRARLEAPLDEAERRLLGQLIGFDQPPRSPAELAIQHAVTLPVVTEWTEQLRVRLHERAPALVSRLRYEIGRELQAADGVVHGHLVARGTLLQTLAEATDDRELGLRLVAFCFPQDFHLRFGRLAGVAPRRFRRLLRALRRIVVPHRLPLRISELSAQLAAENLEAPHGLLVHLLRTELRVAVQIDARIGEVAVPDPRSATSRLFELFAELNTSMTLDDLQFAYRDRYRRASRSALEQRLRSCSAFIMLGPNRWSLRRWHGAELAAVAPLVDKVARRVCAEGGRHDVAKLFGDERPDDRTIWLVLDQLGKDPRVRLLGRGELCPATHNRSQVLDELLREFRRAAGDVVVSMFVANHPPERRRLVRRLLEWNRLFVTPAEDRVDTLTNYPFNEERMKRLLELVSQHLAKRTGYAHVSALKAALDRTDLGGSWLTPELLSDVLRRHSSFDVLPGGLVGRADLGLGHALRRALRQALREARQAMSVDDIVRVRPELAEFAGCLAALLADDPLVQGSDGGHFALL